MNGYAGPILAPIYLVSLTNNHPVFLGPQTMSRSFAKNNLDDALEELKRNGWTYIPKSLKRSFEEKLREEL